jgi:DNA-binding CsgD family transcriptional regulator
MKKKQKIVKSINYFDLEKFLKLTTQGLTNQEIAIHFLIKRNALHNRITRYYKFTNTKNISQLLVWALKNEIITLEEI